jgi:hypothetical protein
MWPIDRNESLMVGGQSIKQRPFLTLSGRQVRHIRVRSYYLDGRQGPSKPEAIQTIENAVTSVSESQN